LTAAAPVGLEADRQGRAETASPGRARTPREAQAGIASGWARAEAVDPGRVRRGPWPAAALALRWAWRLADLLAPPRLPRVIGAATDFEAILDYALREDGSGPLRLALVGCGAAQAGAGVAQLGPAAAQPGSPAALGLALAAVRRHGRTLLLADAPAPHSAADAAATVPRSMQQPKPQPRPAWADVFTRGLEHQALAGFIAARAAMAAAATAQAAHAVVIADLTSRSGVLAARLAGLSDFIAVPVVRPGVTTQAELRHCLAALAAAGLVVPGVMLDRSAPRS